MQKFDYEYIDYDVPTLCYDCHKEVGWLAPDCRCKDCTHMTVEEIEGYEAAKEEWLNEPPPF